MHAALWRDALCFCPNRGSPQKVLDLSWSSSTRLLIHFGDSPCHGNRYHDGHPVNGPDSYPSGNPDGAAACAATCAATCAA